MHDRCKVIVKERNSSSRREKLYVKPPEQDGVVCIHMTAGRNLYKWLIMIFLPVGYPESVSKDYIAYQVWDTAQAFCSTICGILATQEVLRGVGVGDQNATPLAATITWVLKDGCGHIGRILFAFSHGNYLDAYSKKWRMYADILNNAAMCIEIALPQFKVYSMFALCISTVMKAIVGVAGGATRVAMTQHHAIKGNLADVSAKDSAQETAVNLIASLVSLLILTHLGCTLQIFMLMMILHITCNYFAVRAVCLRTLNEPRFLLLINKYLRQEIIANPCEINKTEPIVFYQLGPCILDQKICGFKISLGGSMENVSKANNLSVEHLYKIIKVYSKRNYMVVPTVNTRNMHVLLKENASVDDMLCAYFHAVLLAVVTCAINDEPLTIYKTEDSRPFTMICATLQSLEWSREEAGSNGRFAYKPSAALLTYINMIVTSEWSRLKSGLNKTGWDLSKHLLITDQWRIVSSARVDTAPTPSTDEASETDSPQRLSSFPFVLQDRRYSVCRQLVFDSD